MALSKVSRQIHNDGWGLPMPDELTQPVQKSGAVAQARSRGAGAVEHREPKVGERRLRWIPNVPARADGTASLAGQEDRQIVVIVAVAVAEGATVGNHARELNNLMQLLGGWIK